MQSNLPVVPGDIGRKQMNTTCVGCRDDVKLPFEFKMAFQPIVDMAAHRVWGYEALVRGLNGEFGVFDPEPGY